MAKPSSAPASYIGTALAAMALSALVLTLLTLIVSTAQGEELTFRSTDFWSNMQGVCALVATSSLMGSAVFAYAQYSNSRHERHLALYNDMFARLMSNEHIAARRWIYQNLRFSKSTPDEQIDAFVRALAEPDHEKIKLCLNALDQLGFLVAQGWLDDDKTFGWLSPIVLKTWDRLEPLVLFEQRRRPDPEYYSHCRDVVNRCLPVDKRGQPLKAERTSTNWLPNSL